MDDPDRLYTTGKAAIAQGRIGQPVFLRLFAHLTPKDPPLQEVLSDALRCATGWLSGSVVRVFALGRFEDGQGTVSLAFAEGQSALISLSFTEAGSSRLNWTLVGQRGTLCYEGELLPLQPLGQLPDVEIEPISEALTQSLQTGMPADVPAERSP